MKKQDGRKLRLDRETLVPLAPDALDGVAGGIAVPPVSLPCGTVLSCVISRLVCR